jgi:thymidylate kinase
MKGKLIAIYGVNNIGKTTHALRLTKRLRQDGYRAVYVKYPVYSLRPTGVFLNKILRGSRGNKQSMSEEELQMWFTLNRYQFESKLREMLERGVIVVAEDYTGTGIGWGMTKGAKREWLEEINRGLLREDFAILMEGKRAVKSREASHIHESDDILIARAEKNFSKLAALYRWKRIKVQKTKQDTAEAIYLVVRKFLTA